MKSVVALLAILAVARAGVVLEDGYVGSWFDTIEVTGAADLVAPSATDFVYTGLDDNVNAMTNVTDGYDYLSVSFTTDEGTDTDYYASCTLTYTLWNAAGDAVENQVVCSCSIYTTSGYCYFNAGIKPGTYMAEIVTMDWIGNWQVIDSTAEATLMDVVVANNYVDTMAPVIVSSVPDGAATVTIPAMNEDATDAGAFVELYVEAHDNENDDNWATGVAWAGVTITDSDDVTMFMPLTYVTYNYVDGDTVNEYGNTIQWYNWAEADSWTIDSFDAVDYAGNWATEVAGFDITLETEVTEEDSGRPPQCDTFSLGASMYSTSFSSDYDVIDSTANVIGYFPTDYVSFNMECNADYVGWNYAGALFASPQVQLDGATSAASLWAQTETGDLPPAQMTMSTAGSGADIYDWSYPGASLYGSGDASYWYDDWYVYEGYPAGDYTLDRVYTSTETGAVQVYDSALGAASSVVPSVVVVAVALVAAFL